MTKKRILSGVQPTSNSLHLGNFLGAINNWTKMQNEFEAMFFVPNLHAITVQQDPEQLRERTLRVVAMYIAMGIDPEVSGIFIQSQIPQHAELAWILTCLTGLGEAKRMTQFKDKASKNEANINVGLLSYPMLMAADILLYQADLVPVGEDQRQHLELTRELANRFNNRYGTVFTIPEPYIMEQSAKIYDLQNPEQKMSKSAVSDNGIIWILDNPKRNSKKIKSAVTDNDNKVKYNPLTKPGISNLLVINSALSGVDIKELESKYADAGYGLLKSEVAEILEEKLDSIVTNFNELITNKDYLWQIITTGKLKATEISELTLAKVYEVMGLVR